VLHAQITRILLTLEHLPTQVSTKSSCKSSNIIMSNLNTKALANAAPGGGSGEFSARVPREGPAQTEGVSDFAKARQLDLDSADLNLAPNRASRRQRRQTRVPRGNPPRRHRPSRPHIQVQRRRRPRRVQQPRPVRRGRHLDQCIRHSRRRDLCRCPHRPWQAHRRAIKRGDPTRRPLAPQERRQLARGHWGVCQPDRHQRARSDLCWTACFGKR
jgi:hypothetical protein